MKKRQWIFLITLTLLFWGLLFFLKTPESNQPDRTTKPNPPGNVVPPPASASSPCFQKFKNKSPSTIVKETFAGETYEKENNWTIYHLRDDRGRVWILKHELDQGGDHREVKRLTLFLEDQDEVPLRRPLDNPADEINPSPETLQKYLNKGELFYHEQAQTFWNQNQALTLINANQKLIRVILDDRNQQKVLQCDEF